MACLTANGEFACGIKGRAPAPAQIAATWADFGNAPPRRDVRCTNSMCASTTKRIFGRCGSTSYPPAGRSGTTRSAIAVISPYWFDGTAGVLSACLGLGQVDPRVGILVGACMRIPAASRS